MSLTNAQPKVRGERGRPIVETAGLRKTFRYAQAEGGGRRGSRPHRDLGRDPRLPRSQRVRQDDDDPHAARADPPDVGNDVAVRATGAERASPHDRRIGAVVEQPGCSRASPVATTCGCSAIAGGIDERRVDEVLELVGLRERAADRVKGYSLGMKQRLALAATLLRDPGPADPRRADERARSRRHPGDPRADALARRPGGDDPGLQPHPERTAAGRRPRHDHQQGKASGSGTGGSDPRGEPRWRTPHRRRTRPRRRTVLTAEGLVVVRDHESMLVTGAADPADITRLLAEQGLYVSSLRPSSNDLESAFLEITGEDGQPDGRNRAIRRARLHQRPAGHRHDQPHPGRTAAAAQAARGVVPGGADGGADRGGAGQLLVRHPAGHRGAGGGVPHQLRPGGRRTGTRHGEEYLAGVQGRAGGGAQDRPERRLRVRHRWARRSRRTTTTQPERRTSRCRYSCWVSAR